MTEEEIKQKEEELEKKKNEIEAKEKERAEYKKELDTYKAYSENLVSNLKEIGYNEDEELTAFIDRKKKEAEEREKNKKKPEGKEMNSEELDELRSEFKTIKSKYEELNKSHKQLKKEKEQSEEQAKRAKLRDKLLKGFQRDDGSYSHAGAEARVENLILKGIVDIDKEGKAVWRDENDPDIKHDFDDGLKKYMDRDDVKRDYIDSQKFGSGNKGGGKSIGGEISLEERRKELRKINNFTI